MTLSILVSQSYGGVSGGLGNATYVYGIVTTSSLPQQQMVIDPFGNPILVCNDSVYVYVLNASSRGDSITLFIIAYSWKKDPDWIINSITNCLGPWNRIVSITTKTPIIQSISQPEPEIFRKRAAITSIREPTSTAVNDTLRPLKKTISIEPALTMRTTSPHYTTNKTVTQRESNPMRTTTIASSTVTVGEELGAKTTIPTSRERQDITFSERILVVFLAGVVGAVFAYISWRMWLWKRGIQ